jgi:hypothetical protein
LAFADQRLSARAWGIFRTFESDAHRSDAQASESNREQHHFAKLGGDEELGIEAQGHSLDLRARVGSEGQKAVATRFIHRLGHVHFTTAVSIELVTDGLPEHDLAWRCLGDHECDRIGNPVDLILGWDARRRLRFLVRGKAGKTWEPRASESTEWVERIERKQRARRSTSQSTALRQDLDYHRFSSDARAVDFDASRTDAVLAGILKGKRPAQRKPSAALHAPVGHRDLRLDAELWPNGTNAGWHSEFGIARP